MNELRELKDKWLVDQDRDLTAAKIRVYLEEIESTDSTPSFPKFASCLQWINVDRPLRDDDLQGKLLLLDFWTFCCINCMHIIPDLNELDTRYPAETGFSIIGVHSAKFAHEKDADSILSAVQRHKLKHPVVNDADSWLWDELGVSCWPTLVLVSPSGKLLTMFEGEGNRESLFAFVEAALKFYSNRSKLPLNKNPLPMIPLKDIVDTLTSTGVSLHLSFPGKVCVSKDGQIAVADSGNNRIIVGSMRSDDSTGSSNVFCQVHHVIGGKSEGSRDGTFGGRGGSSQPEFRFPQGVAWWNDDERKLLVADTDNHLLRVISFPKNGSLGKVETLAGIPGLQGQDFEGGLPGPQQEISSPWDVCLGKSIDGHDVAFIAMAGTHQIWVYFFCHSLWYKKVFFPASTCVRFLGSGVEENRNNSYPPRAGFAQPSGVCLGFYSGDDETTTSEGATSMTPSTTNVSPVSPVASEPSDSSIKVGPPPPPPPPPPRPPPPPSHSSKSGAKDGINSLFVADAESSTIRDVDLKDGATRPLVGGDHDPKNLFAFGDCDGEGMKARLQHPLGICFDYSSNRIYVADSYNHKIKLVCPKSGSCSTIWPPAEGQLNEPGGLDFFLWKERPKLLVADTNNHRVLLLDLESGQAPVVDFVLDSVVETLPVPLQLPSRGVFESSMDEQRVVDGDLEIRLELTLKEGFKQTADAPSFFICRREIGQESQDPPRGFVVFDGATFGATVNLGAVVGRDCPRAEVKVEFVVFYCQSEDGICAYDASSLVIPVLLDSSADSSTIRVARMIPR